jgi:hypothetical protein
MGRMGWRRRGGERRGGEVSYMQVLANTSMRKYLRKREKKTFLHLLAVPPRYLSIPAG